ncbi:MAG: cysteate synthase, partial [Thermoplasmata archaeon]|nr:cysteate synthase [Thermoplasmata archaeon]
QLELKDYPGMWQFFEWLPVHAFFVLDSSSISYKSEALAKELGLKNLYISFSGYWPERSAVMKTCSFKELEALPTFQRIIENPVGKLVIASAGNTANAFAYTAVITKMPVILVVPESCLHRLWLPIIPDENVKLITLKKGNDYSDAISLAGRMTGSIDGLIPEGGAKNIARRDGMSTVMLEAVTNTIKKLPQYYFQAIGSGTGAIATWEAAQRLIVDGRFGGRLPNLHLAQNLPFAPIYNAWRAGRREIIPEEDMPDAKKLIEQMEADILSNRKPPYSIKGGVYDALTSSSGEMYGVTNEELNSAGKLFEDLEGIDILPAAKVAVAALLQAVEQNKVEADDIILINITGGGKERLLEDQESYKIEPDIVVDNPDVALDDIKEVIFN